MNKINVGVLRGGPSNEYDVSLATGANVLKSLKDSYPEKYTTHDVLIDRKGDWHIDGLKRTPEVVLAMIDVAFLALHGEYGEDGKVQKLLEDRNMPFTGSGSVASAVGMNKITSKKIFRENGIRVAMDKVVESHEIKKHAKQISHEVFRSFLMPVIIKPASSGSSVGIMLCRTASEIETGLIGASTHSEQVLIEEYIKGVEATVGVIENWRGEELYSLPAVEIRPSSDFFDFEAKYKGKSQEIVPATFSNETKKELAELARKVHHSMGLRQYSRSDFIIHPKRGIFALEVNTLPGLTNESLIPKALRAIGSDTDELVDHLISSAISGL